MIHLPIGGVYIYIYYIGPARHMIVDLFLKFSYAGSTDNVSVTGEVAITCLNKAISYFHDHSDYLKNIAAMIFPLLLVMPQVCTGLQI
jgi:hypothetical protein